MGHHASPIPTPECATPHSSAYLFAMDPLLFAAVLLVYSLILVWLVGRSAGQNDASSRNDRLNAAAAPGARAQPTIERVFPGYVHDVPTQLLPSNSCFFFVTAVWRPTNPATSRTSPGGCASHRVPGRAPARHLSLLRRWGDLAPGLVHVRHLWSPRRWHHARAHGNPLSP